MWYNQIKKNIIMNVTIHGQEYILTQDHQVYQKKGAFCVEKVPPEFVPEPLRHYKKLLKVKE